MTIPQDKINLAINVLKQVAQRYPRAYGFCHANNNTHPERLDFIILAARELNKLDPLFGMNGKRGNPSDSSSDVIDYGVGRDVIIADVVGRAGEHNGDIGLIGWGDVTSAGPGIFVDPFSLNTKFDYTGNQPPVTPPVTPKPPATIRMPDREEMRQELKHLHEFYKSQDGLQRPEGLWINGEPDFEGIAAWFLDVYINARLVGKSKEVSRQLYIDAIKQSEEWKGKH